MKTTALIVAMLFTLNFNAFAAPLAPLTAPSSLLRHVDWQTPEQLPRRLRNHCAYDVESGRP